MKAQSSSQRAAKVSTPSDREIRTEHSFDAPRQRVWQALTDPKLVAQWWGRGNKLVIERMEVERGGHWRFVEHSPEGVHGFEGRYREVTPRWIGCWPSSVDGERIRARIPEIACEPQAGEDHAHLVGLGAA